MRWTSDLSMWTSFFRFAAKVQSSTPRRDLTPSKDEEARPSGSIPRRLRRRGKERARSRQCTSSAAFGRGRGRRQRCVRPAQHALSRALEPSGAPYAREQVAPDRDTRGKRVRGPGIPSLLRRLDGRGQTRTDGSFMASRGTSSPAKRREKRRGTKRSPPSTP